MTSYRSLTHAWVALLGLAGSTLAVADIEVRALARPSFETEAFFDDDAGGKANADDPAIWAHPKQPQQSLIVSTLKEGGLAVFSLRGLTLQRIAAPASDGDDAPGRFNNVDIVTGFKLGTQFVDLAVVSDRGHDKLRIYRINPNHGAEVLPLTDITDAAAPFVFNATQDQVNDQRTAYGLAVTRNRLGGAVVAVSQREQSRLATLELVATAQGQVSYRRKQFIDMPSSFTLPNLKTWTPCQDEDGVQPQFEGMVIDSRTNTLYAAQEQVGIWKISLDHPTRKTLVERVRTFGVPYERVWDADEEEFACTYLSGPKHARYAGKTLSADAEGLTLAYEGGDAYLLASSQGDSTFAVYAIDDHFKLEGSFRIGDSLHADGTVLMDGAQHCDGMAVLNQYLGPDFPKGLLVTHDGENTPESTDEAGETRENTNFKLVPLQRVMKLRD